MRRRLTLNDRIAAYAVKYWLAKGMTEWPTVRRTARGLRMRQSDIESEQGDAYTVQGYNCEDDALGDYEVAALTQDVDKAWCRYYFSINRRCTCGQHTVVTRPNPTTNSYDLVDQPSR